MNQKLISDSDATKEYGIALVLSGYPFASELFFWRAFIELQARLPVNKSVTHIVAHCLNPELVDLIELTYSPQALQCEDHKMVYDNLLMQSKVDELQALQNQSTKSVYHNESLSYALCSAYSRANAIRLISKMPVMKCQVLMVNWDLSDSGSKQISQIILDSSLPENYLYLAYSPDVDMGYSDGWILASWELACRFSNFDQFVLDSLANRNGYVESFTKLGWPLSQRQSGFENLFSLVFSQRFFLVTAQIVSDVFNSLEGDLKGDNYFRKILRRLLRPIYLMLTKPPITAENSRIADSKLSLATFPKDFALNLRPLLKYFILHSGLRDVVRFLTKDDFHISSKLGQLINPQQIILVVNEADESSLQMLSKTPLTLTAIYQIDREVIFEYLPNGKGGWTKTILTPTTHSPKDQVDFLLIAAQNYVSNLSPILFVPSINYYLKCIDWFYLNALMKYFIWKKLDFISINSEVNGNLNPDFPDLCSVQSRTFAMLPCITSIIGMRRLLNGDNTYLTDKYELKSTLLLKFLAVSAGRNLF